MASWLTLFMVACVVSSVLVVYNTMSIVNITTQINKEGNADIIATNAGTEGIGVVLGKQVNNIMFKNITNADGSIEVTEDSEANIRIRAIPSADSTTGSNVGSDGYGVFYDKVGDEMQFKNIAAADSTIIVTEDVDHNIRIRADVSQIETTTGVNVGTLGTGVLYQQVGQELQFKNVAAGDATMTVQEDANQNILVTSNVTGSAVGTQGVSTYVGQTGQYLEFRSVAAEDDTMVVTQSGNDILLKSGLEFSNAGNDGVGPLFDVDGNQIEFRNIASGDPSLQIAADDPNKNLVITPMIGSSSNTLAAGNDGRFSDAQIINVKSSNPGPGEFSSIAAAIASITDAEETKPYLVQVGPGQYTEPAIVVPSWIHVTGSTILATVIFPDDVNHHIIELQANSEISFLNLQGAGSGYAAVASLDAGDFTQMHKISIQDCDTGLLITSDTQDCYTYAEYIDINGDYTTGVKVESTGGFIMELNMENSYFIPSTGSPVQVHATGAGTAIQMLSVGVLAINDMSTGFLIENNASLLLLSTYTRETNISLIARNGATVRSGGISFDSLTTDVLVENTGSPSHIDLQAMVTTFRATSAVRIEHPNATGTIDIAPTSVIYVHPSADVSVSSNKYHSLSVGARNAQFSTIADAIASINPIFTATITNGSATITSADLFDVSMSGHLILGTGIPALTTFTYVSSSSGTLSQAATASATAPILIQRSSEGSPWLVEVQPGTYLEDDIIVPRGVSIVGLGSKAVIVAVQPTTVAQFTMSSYSHLENMVLLGSVGSGNITLLLENVTSCDFRNLVFYNGDYPLKIVGGDGHNIIGFSSINFIGIFQTAIEIDASVLNGSSDTQRIAFRDTLVNTEQPDDVPSTSSDPFFKIHGPYARVTFNGVVVTGRDEHEGFCCYDGCEVNITSTDISRCNVGLRTVNDGDGPNVSATGLIIRDSITNDLLIEHPQSTGSINGTFDQSKVDVDPNANISLSYYDPGGGGLILTGDLQLGPTADLVTNIQPLIVEGGPLGMISQAPYIIDDGGLNITVKEGRGYVFDPVNNIIRYLSWSDTSITLTANVLSYVYINGSGIPTQSVSVPNFEENIMIARVRTDNVDIEFIDIQPIISRHSNLLIDSFHRLGHGALFSTGGLCQVNASLEVLVGSAIYLYSTNQFNTTGKPYATPYIAYYHASGVWTKSSQTSLDTTQYDDGSNLVALTAGHYAKHSMYVVGDGANERYFLVYAQAEFAVYDDAVAAPLPTPPSYFEQGVATLASFIIQEGLTNALANGSSPFSERMVLNSAMSGSGIGGTANHGDLLGLAADDHPQYLLTDGSRAMTGPLDMGTNAIINATTVNGVTVQTHASRHLPNGSDPLTTAAPATNLSSTTSNLTGTANSLARSDHTHAVVTYSVSDVGLLPNVIPDESTAATLVGNSSALARANHSHIVPSAAPTATFTVSSANAVGTANTFARSDHSHAFTFGSPSTTLSATTTNNHTIIAGQGFAPANHTHAILANVTAATLSPDQSNSVGTNAALARADHIHNVPTAIAVQINADSLSQGVASSFARSDHQHSILTDVPVQLTPNQSLSAGVSTALARADHVHLIPTAAATGLNANSTNTDGSAATFSRSDHTHAIATGSPSSITPDQVNTAGTSSNLARADHIHNIPTAAPLTALSATTSNTQGSASSFARSDHTHSISTGAASTQTPDQANATGSSVTLARADHVHQLVTAAPTTDLSATTANTIGVATSFARSDHIHAILTAAATGLNASSTNTAGTSASLARADHTHAISVGGTPAAIVSSTPDEGVSTSFARSDHVHNHGNLSGGSLHSAATTSVNGFLSSTDKTKLDSLFNWGQVAYVDKTYGNDSNGAVGGAPYLTVTAALSAANGAANSSTPITVLVKPGLYAEAGTMTIGSFVTLRGVGQRSVTISRAAVANTDFVTISANGHMSHCTISLTCTGTFTIRGVILSDTSTSTITDCRITVDQTSTGASEVIGILSNGSQTPLEYVTAIEDTAVLVNSAGTSTKCALRLTTANSCNTVNCVFACTRTAGAGTTFYGAETNNASAIWRDHGSKVFGTIADITQTTGTITLRDTRLIGNTANALSFTALSGYPLYFGGPSSGNLGNGTHFLANGGPGGQQWMQYHAPRPMLIRAIYGRVAAFQNVLTNTATLTVLKNGSDTAVTLLLQSTLSTTITGSQTTVSVDFATGDLIAVRVVVAGGNANGLTVVLDAY
jgi:hypothetical protein